MTNFSADAAQGNVSHPDSIHPNAAHPNATHAEAVQSSVHHSMVACLPPETDARRIDITIPSNAEFVRVVRLALLGVASRMNFSFDDVEDIKLALSEACNNAVLHSEAKESARVLVSFVPYTNRLEILIADEGRVPPPGLPRPRHPLGNVDSSADDWQDLPEGGLGLFLMQSLMDEVQHRTGADANTIVRLVKYLPGQKPVPPHSSHHANSSATQNNDGSVPPAANA